MLKIKVYVIEQKNVESHLKISKKKSSYEGFNEIIKRKKRFLGKRQRKELRRVKKHAFKKHLRRQ